MTMMGGAIMKDANITGRQSHLVSFQVIGIPASAKGSPNSRHLTRVQLNSYSQKL